MNPVRRRAFVVVGLMAGSVAVAAAWRPSNRLADTMPKMALESAFPKQFADWQLDDRMPVQLVSPDQQALLNKIYNQTLSRTYVNRQGDRVMLSVAYGGDQSDATRAHRPEVCYPAQGFQVLSMRSGTVRLEDGITPVRRLVTKLGNRVEPVTYWVTVGERATTSGTEQKLAQLRYSTQGLVPDGMLVRVSTIDTDSARSFAVQERFLREISASVSPASRARLFGR
jgi:EpsI family protein